MDVTCTALDTTQWSAHPYPPTPPTYSPLRSMWLSSSYTYPEHSNKVLSVRFSGELEGPVLLRNWNGDKKRSWSMRLHVLCDGAVVNMMLFHCHFRHFHVTDMSSVLYMSLSPRPLSNVTVTCHCHISLSHVSHLSLLTMNDNLVKPTGSR